MAAPIQVSHYRTYSSSSITSSVNSGDTGFVTPNQSHINLPGGEIDGLEGQQGVATSYQIQSGPEINQAGSGGSQLQEATTMDHKVTKPPLAASPNTTSPTAFRSHGSTSTLRELETGSIASGSRSPSKLSPSPSTSTPGHPSSFVNTASNSYPAEDSPAYSPTQPFLERLSSSSLGSLEIEREDLDEQLAELGIYDDDLDDLRDEDGDEINDEEGSYSEGLSGSEDAEWLHRSGNGASRPKRSSSGEGDDTSDASPLTPMTRKGKRSRRHGIANQQGSRRRRRGIWTGNGVEDNGSDRSGQNSLLEIVSPLLYAHPLAFLPILPILPYSFLPAGAIFFVPALVVIAGLSICASIVITYMSRYLKAASFEEISHKIAGKPGLWGARSILLLGIVGVSVGWLRAAYPILQPVIQTVFPSAAFFQSRILWTFLLSIPLMPPLISVRHNYAALTRHADFSILLLPLVVFLVIGRTVEIVKSGLSPSSPDAPTAIAIMGEENHIANLGKRYDVLSDENGLKAGTALLLIMLLFTPHPHILPIQSSLVRESRARFPICSLAVVATLVVLGLPFALVPYYLLPNNDASSLEWSPVPIDRAGIFGALSTEKKDDWLNLARVSMVALLLYSTSSWVNRGREICLKALGVEREGRLKASRWIGIAMWFLIVIFAVAGGWAAGKIEVLGMACVLAVGWLIPAIYFIKTFHLSSPLAIVFPSTMVAPNSTPAIPASGDSSFSTAADILLARKERQLQKKRLGRRLWQDLIVLVGILPLGAFAVIWACGLLFGLA